MSASFDIRGAHALVTGASRGIGVRIAQDLAARGATVTVVARSGGELQAVADAIGGHALVADLSSAADVDDLVKRAEDGAGPVDVLVNNAAVAVVGKLADQTPGQLRSSFEINTIAPAELCRQVAPGMVARGRGRILNVSSLAGITAIPTLSTYGASKAGLVHFSATLQRELRRSAVRLTIAQLGEVSGTDMMEQARTSPTIAAVSRRLARVKAMPDLTPEVVAAKLIAATLAGKRQAIVPARVGPLHRIRELPSRINDLILLGID